MKVFMISYGGGHSNIIASVYREIIKEPNTEVIYAALTGAPLKLKDTDVTFVTISDLVKDLSYYSEVLKYGRKYGLPFHNKEFGIPEIDTVCYYGVGMHDLIEELGKAKAEERFNDLNRKAFLPVQTMRNILKSINPDICVITSSPRMEKATGIAGSQLGIPVVRINDLPVCEPISYKCTLCVMNEWAKNYAITKAGVPDSDIYVTGQPIFEADIDIDPFYVEEVKKTIGVDHFSKVVTFFAENGIDQSREIHGLFEIARVEQDVVFVIKLHPNQQPDIYSDPKLDNVLITNKDANPFFHFSDLVITTFSTTGMEAAIFGIPVVVMNYDQREYSPNFVEMGIAVLCDSPESLKDIVDCYLNTESEEYKTLMKSQRSFQYVRNASKNISKLIRDLAVQVKE